MSDSAIKELMQINHDDNLNLLDIPLVEIPDDVLFPEELNQYLRGRIEVPPLKLYRFLHNSNYF